jgi:hypothetical protein
VDRRGFLGAGLAAAAGLLLPRPAQAASKLPALLRGLRARLPDLRRRFVFEYYPWYGVDPYLHWNSEDRTPPQDLASPYMPKLGAYDSRSRAALEQHARWIADSGAGSINLSWWGPGSYEDRAAHLVMDVMRAHDVKVAFHLEPYADDHGRRFAQDVLYLIEEFGERRAFDAFLLLRDADGGVGPVFKGFRTILPAAVRDCHGLERPVVDFTSDREWRDQLDGLRSTLRGSFDRVRVFADTTDVERAARSGFDGIALYDNLTEPSRDAPAARTASERGLLFSFNVNAGYSAVAPRRPRFDDCGQPIVPHGFVPPHDHLDLTTAAGRELAAALARRRMVESFAATVAVQADAALANAQRGFFLAYVNSFNEWHEGSAFEPMKDAADLTAEERAFGYHNPARGDYRLALLKDLIQG